MSRPRRNPLPRRTDAQGFVLMALLVLLTMGGLYFLVSNLTPEAVAARRQAQTEAALVEAREALIGYTLKYRDDEAAQGRPGLMYGYLLLPDLGAARNNNVSCTTEGCDANTPTGISCDGNNIYPTMIGRLPWRTLGTGPLRDGHGECLWLIVSSLHLRKQCSNPVLPAMNWDTLGQLDIVTANGTSALNSALAVHDRPIAIIFSPGPPLAGQDRSNPGGNDVSQCGGNYNAANYLDPGVTSALGGVTNYLAGTNNASGLTGDSNPANDPDDTQKKPMVVQGKTFKSGSNYLSGSCTGSDCNLLANDVGLPVTSDMLFGALRNSSYFRNDINSMLDQMASCLRDQIAAGLGFTPDALSGFTPPADKAVGRIPSTAPTSDCYNDAQPPLGYFNHYKDQVFVAKPTTGSWNVNVDGAAQTCSAAVLFGSQRGTGQARSNTTQRNSPDNYLEGANLSGFTTPGTPSFSGPSQFARVSTAQTPYQDIVRCIPAGANLTAVQSTALTATQQLVAYDPGTSTLALGKANVIASTASSTALFGCAWSPEDRPLGAGLRSYFKFSFATVGTDVGNTGFAFALIDAESNPSMPCGRAGSHLGYSGDNGVTPKVRFPKIGIEFDQSRNTGFPGSGENSTTVGRNDPCYLSSCGAVPAQTANTHAAIVYWGHEATNGTDAVTLPDGDDNVHGFPSATSLATVRRPPKNPGSSPGLEYVNLRTGGQIFHVRVEVTPTRVVDATAVENNKTVTQTKVWILANSATVANQIAAMKNTTRPMSQLYSGFAEKLRDTASVYDVAEGPCSSGTCPANQTCGTNNVCYRQGLRRVRLGFTGSQSTQDQQVTITNMFTTWLP